MARFLLAKVLLFSCDRFTGKDIRRDVMRDGIINCNCPVKYVNMFRILNNTEIKGLKNSIYVRDDFSQFNFFTVGFLILR